MKTFGERVAHWRKQKNLTQKQLALLLHVSDSSVSRWEQNEGYPDVALLVPLADCLGVNVDDLLREDRGYRHIQKKDIEEWLPFLLALCAILSFYLLVKLGVSTVITLIVYGILMIFSTRLMKKHTDRTHAMHLHHVHALFHYFVTFNVMVQVMLIVLIAKTMQIPLFMMVGQNIELNDMGMVGQSLMFVYVVSFVVALVVSLVFYFAKQPQK